MRPLALGAAALAAAVVPGAPPGLGVPLVAALIAAATLTAARRTRDLLLFGAPALVLASFAVVLDAGWVVATDLLAAWVFATLAVGGPTLLAPLAPLAALREAPALLPEPSSRAAPALRGLALGAAVAVPFAVLFVTADAAFAAIADSTPHPTLSSLPGRLGAFAVVLTGAVGLALAARKPLTNRPLVPRRGLTTLEWALPLAVLDALFLAFVAVQVTVLFGGHDHVLRTTGLTYAEYARQGFWQLLAAAVLTLVVVKGATLLAGTRTPAERRLLRGLLAVLSACTVVVVASAFHRLRLYESAYGLTRPRLAAEAFSLWLGAVFGLLLAAGALRRAAAFPRAALAWTALALVAFSAASPDARIAERNVERWRDTGRIDVGYLETLSADSVPALTRLPAPLRERALARITHDLSEDEPWSSANLSRRRGRRLLSRLRGPDERGEETRSPRLRP